MFINRFDLETTLNEKDLLVLADKDSIINSTQLKAISIVKSYIQHRYDPDVIFIDINNYNISTTYAIGDLVFYNNLYYTCIEESTGNTPTDTDYFEQIDSRDPSIVDIVCVLTIWLLFRKVQPRNMPEWITDEYERVKSDLISYQKGIRMIELTVKEDADGEEEGHRISYGSETQKDWNF